MSNILFAVATQSLTFIPLALGISMSYRVLRATDMTLDGSFVLGAAIFARLVTLGFSPLFAGLCALFAGGCAGILVALIQRGGRVDPLLAGILATFILSSGNLILMGKPNINLLSQTTLLSDAFAKGEIYGWGLVFAITGILCLFACLFSASKAGLTLRAFGDNSALLARLGRNIENCRMLGFAFTNCLAAAAGCLTAQTIGYADITMGFGMTLTGIGAIILGQQIIKYIISKNTMRVPAEFSACLLGVLFYFFAINSLLRLDINPIYLKMILGIVLIFFLRAATNTNFARRLS